MTVTNSGTAPLTIAGITIGADFQEVNDCGSEVAAGARCTIKVTFVPTTTGNLQEAITVTDNTPGSPHNITLTGQGVDGGPPPAPTLTGYCFGPISGTNHCLLVKDLTSCPVGTRASQPEFVVGCLPPTSQYLDVATSCQGKTSKGLTVKGSCVAAN